MVSKKEFYLGANKNYKIIFSNVIILDAGSIELTRLQTVDISGLCVHPACVVSATLTTIRAETAGSHPHPESLLLNVSGRLLMVQREHCTDNSEVVCE